MALEKRAQGIFWYDFWYEQKRYRGSTRQRDKRKAKEIESAEKHRLMLLSRGVKAPMASPSLKDFLERDFLPFVQAKFKGKTTLTYYEQGAERLLAADFAGLPLNELNDSHSAAFQAKHAKLSPSTINCGLRTFRRALNLAYQWGKLERMPKVTLAKGERQRERILTDEELTRYLAACEQPWKDVAVILYGTGCRPGEILPLRWEHIYLNGSTGMIQILQGKSRAARRVLPMVKQVYDVLRARHEVAGKPESGWVFPAEKNPATHLGRWTAKNQHGAALQTVSESNCKAGEKPIKPFPPYTLRHSALTRLAALTDAFCLMKIAGHSSLSMTSRYIHSQQNSIETAFKLLDAPKPEIPAETQHK